MQIRSFSIFLGLFSALSLSACEPITMVTTGASIVSVLQSEETLGDKAISWATDQDCSIFNVAKGQAYCQPNGPDIPEQYCYRNLGGITCYKQPNPHASSDTTVFAKAEPAIPLKGGSSDPEHRPPASMAERTSKSPGEQNPAH